MSSPSGSQALAAAEAFTVIAGTLVFFRLFTRVILIRNAGFEDICIVFAMACSIGLTVTISEQVQNGMGQHIFTLTPDMMSESQKAFWASVWVYNLGLSFTKIGILVQYLRILAIPRYRIACWILLSFVSAYGIWTFLGSIFLCTPVQYFWNKTIKGACLNQFGVWFTNASVNIVQDFAIIILPMPVLRGLTISKGQKKALMAVFALGGFVCIVSIIRLRTLVAISNSTDPTFDNPPAATWSSIEINVGIMCACLPSLRPLLATILPGYFPAISRFTNIRTNDIDEERPKMNTASTHTRPTTAGTDSTRSQSWVPASNARSSTNESELETTLNHQATVFGTGSRVHGHVRQVTIGHPLRSNPADTPTPSLPMVPENIASIESVELSRQNSRKSRKDDRHERRPHTPSPSLQKPLPTTPFPVNDSGNI